MADDKGQWKTDRFSGASSDLNYQPSQVENPGE